MIEPQSFKYSELWLAKARMQPFFFQSPGMKVDSKPVASELSPCIIWGKRVYLFWVSRKAVITPVSHKHLYPCNITVTAGVETSMKVITRFLHGQKFEFKMPGPNKFSLRDWRRLKMVSKNFRISKQGRRRRDGPRHGAHSRADCCAPTRRLEPSIFPNHNV